jgi:nucleoside-diphosphate-sugar epimerase
MKILLTGANGFIGEYLYEALKANGHEVQTVTRNSEPKFGNKNIACDLEQKSNLDHIIGENEVVVHLAGRAHVMSDTGANKAEAYKSANTDVTRKLAESAHRKGVRRFVFLSSVKVNGEKTQYNCPFTLDDTPSPQDDYGISKLRAENALRSVCTRSSMDYVIIRTPLVYGKGVRANFASLSRIVQSGAPLPFAAIKNKRSFVSLYNLVDALVLSMTSSEASNSTLFVSDGEDLSTPELVRAIAHSQGSRTILLWVPAVVLRAFAGLFRKVNLYSRLCDSLTVDISETRKKLQWIPRYSVLESLEKMSKP